MQSQYLDSLSLPPEAREAIEAHLTEMRKDSAKSVRIRIEQGERARRIKDLIGHGGWLPWLISDEAHSGYKSTRTVERDMALAEALYDHLPQLNDETINQLTNLTALRELVRDTNADALETALHLLKQGITIKGEQSEQLVTIYAIEPRLGEQVRAGKLTISDAHAVAQRLDQINPAPEVVELVISACVRSAGVVEALAVMQREQPAQFDAVAASGSIFNPATEQEVPLSEASRADGTAAVEQDDAERYARHIQHVNDWKATQPARIANLIGRRAQVLQELAAALPDDERQYRVYVYPVAEETEQENL